MLISAGVALAPPGLLFDAHASPEGGAVVAGQGSIQQPDASNTLVHQQSNRLSIDWQSFSVGQPDLVQFNQPAASSIVLNRVTGGSMSQIYGQIQANGIVFLVNPAGVKFGPSAFVQAHGFVASGLEIATDDFMSGNYRFSTLTGEGGGPVINQGLIQAAAGGVSLVGGSVSNEGLIVAQLGPVNLGAGRSAVVDFDGDGLIGFEVDGEVLDNLQNADAAVSNSGEIRADGGQVVMSASVAKDIFSRAVNNEGIVRAGRIEKSGGSVRLVGLGGGVANSGTIDVSASAAGESGGSVNVLSDAIIEQFGTITADAANGDGGSVTLESSDTTLLGGDSVTSARSGGGVGGTVHALGDRVGLVDAASIDVSGELGGGTALVGGDFQGNNADIRNATRTYVGADTTIAADAGSAGDGGRVIVWADEVTRFFGTISGQGGTMSGDGGFAEVSGKELLVFDGNVTLDAANGARGTLLLDPNELNIIAGADGSGADDGELNAGTKDGLFGFADGKEPSNLTAARVVSVLDKTAVTLQANTKIDVEVAIDASGNTNSNTLELDAPTVTFANGANITTKNADLTIGNTKAGNVVLNDGATVTLSTGAGAGNILLKGTANGDATTGAAESLTLSAGTGTVTVTGAVGGSAPLASLTVGSGTSTTFSGAVTVTNGAGAISLTTDEVTFAGGAGKVAGTTILLQPQADTTDIGIGGAAGTLNIDDTDIAALANGFTSITIGTATGKHAIKVDTSTFADPVTIRTPSGGSIAVTGQLDTLAGGDAAAITLDGPDATTTLSADVVTKGGVITISDSVVLAADTVTLDSTNAGGATGADISITGAVDADDAGTKDRALTLRSGTTGKISLTGAVGGTKALAGLTITQSNGATFTKAVTVNDAGGVVTITDTQAGQTVDFQGDLTATSLSTGATGYNLAIKGATNSIGGTTTFANTGTLVLGNDATDKTTLTGGFTATAPSSVSLAGAILTAGDSVIKIGDADTGITLTADTTIETDQITIGGAFGGGSNALTLQPDEAGDAIQIGTGATDAKDALALDDTEIAKLTDDTFTSITIGRADGTHAITVTASSFADPVKIQTPAGGSIAVNGQLDTLAGGDAASLTLDGPDATTTLKANIVTKGGEIKIEDNVVLAANTITLDSTNAGGAAGGANITITGTVDADDAGANDRALTLNSGTAGKISLDDAVGGTKALAGLTITQSNGATFAKAVTVNDGTGAITITDTQAGQTVDFQGDLTAKTFSTDTKGHNVAITGATNSVTTATTFKNTGTLQLGNDATDKTTFVGGLTATAPSAVKTAGSILTTGTALALGPVTLIKNTTLDTGDAATGTITTGAVTGAGQELAVDSGTKTGATITIASADNVSKLTVVDAGDLVKFTGDVGAATAGDVTITNSQAGVTFAGTTKANTLTLTNTAAGKTIQFSGNLTVNTAMSSAANGFDVSILGATNSIAGATTLAHTGNLALGDQSTDKTTFVGGLKATAPSAVKTAGETLTTNKALTLGAVTLVQDTTLDTGNGAAATIVTGAVTGAAKALTLDSGSTAGATITVDSVDNVSLLTVRDAGGLVTFTNDVGAGTAGNITITDSQAGVTFGGTTKVNTLTLTDTANGQTIQFSKDLTVNTAFSTGGDAFNVSILGATNTVTPATTFSNTGTLVLGNDATDKTTFTGGLTATAPGTVKTAGTTLTTDKALKLGAITLDKDTTLDTNAATTAGDITIGAVTGGGNALTLETGNGVAGADVTGTKVTGVSTLALQNIGGTASFSDAVSATTLTVPNTVVKVSSTGSGGTITNAVDYKNTGTLTLGQDGGTQTYTGGLATNNVGGLVTLNGTFKTTDTAITLGDATLGSDTTLNSGTGAVTTGNITGTSDDDFTVTTTGAATVKVGTIGAGNQVNTVTLTGGTSVTLNGNLTTSDAAGNDVKLTAPTVDLNSKTIDTNQTNNDGNVTLITDNLLNAGTIDAGKATFQIAPSNAAKSIEFAANDDGGLATDVFYSSAFAGVTAGAFIIGDGAHNGDIHVGNSLAAFTFNFDLDAQTTGTVFLRNDYSNSTNSDLSLSSGAGVTLLDSDADGDGVIIDLGGGVFTATGNATLKDNVDITATGGITFNNNIAGTAGEDLTFDSGAGNTTVTGSIGAGGNIDAILVDKAGTASFNAAVKATSLTVPNTVVNFNSTGSGGAITKAVDFKNTGTLTLGQGGGTQTYTAGLTTTNVGKTVTLNGSLVTTGQPIALGAATLGSDTTLDTGNAATGTIVTGAVTGANKALSLDSGSTAGATITVDSLDNVSLLKVVDAGGLVTFTNNLGAGTAGDVTITNSQAGVTFAGTTKANTLTLTNTAAGKTIQFSGNLTVNTAMSSAANGFDVSILGATNSIAGATTLAHTGNLALGDQSTDKTTFVGGLKATAPSAVKTAGTVLTTNKALTLGAVTLVQDTTLDTGNGAAATIVTGAVTGAAKALTLDSGSTAGATITVDSVDNVSTLTVRDAGGLVTFTNDVGAGTAGNITITDSQAGVTFGGTTQVNTLTLTDTANGQAIQFSGNLTVNTAVNTGGGGFNVSMLGANNSIAGQTVYNNTGTLQIGDQTTDKNTFPSGLVATAPSKVLTAGTILTTDDAIKVGPVTLLADTTLDTQGTKSTSGITIGAVTGGNKALTIDTGDKAAGADVTGTKVTAVSTLTLQNIGGTAKFTDAVSATTLVVPGTVVNVTSTGTGGTITNAVDFQNTGNVTLGQAGGTQTYGAGSTVKNIGGVYSPSGTIIGIDSAKNVTLNAATTFEVAAGTAFSIGSIDTQGNDLTITADEIQLGDQVLNGKGTSNILLQPVTQNLAVNVASADTTADTTELDLTVAELGQIQDGFATITIGRANANGTLSVDNAVTFNDPLTLQSPGGTISVDKTLSGAGNASLTLTSTNDTLNANLTTAGQAIKIGAATLGADVTLDSGNGANAKITTGAVTGNGKNLTLDSGATAGATITVDSVDNVSLLKVVDAGGLVTFTNNVGAGTAGNITITNSQAGVTFAGTTNANTLALNDTANGQTITFTDNLTVNTAMSSGADGFNVSLLGAVNAIAGATSLAHTGTLKLGVNATDTSTFTGGLNATASKATVAGTVLTVDKALSLGAVTLAKNTTLDTNAATAAGDITIGAVTGGGNALTLETGNVAGANVSGTSVAGVSTLALQNIGTAIFTAGVAATTINLQNIATTAAFNGAVTATTFTVPNTVVNVASTGSGGTITNAVDFKNTGTLTLGQSGGVQTFPGGLATNNVGGLGTLNGTFQTTNQNITLGTTQLGSTTTLNTGNGALVNLKSTVSGGGNNLFIFSDDVNVANNVTSVATLTIQTNGKAVDLGTGAAFLDNNELQRLQPQTLVVNAPGGATITGNATFGATLTEVVGNAGDDLVFPDAATSVSGNFETNMDLKGAGDADRIFTVGVTKEDSGFAAQITFNNNVTFSGAQTAGVLGKEGVANIQTIHADSLIINGTTTLEGSGRFEIVSDNVTFGGAVSGADATLTLRPETFDTEPLTRPGPQAPSVQIGGATTDKVNFASQNNLNNLGGVGVVQIGGPAILVDVSGKDGLNHPGNVAGQVTVTGTFTSAITQLEIVSTEGDLVFEKGASLKARNMVLVSTDGSVIDNIADGTGVAIEVLNDLVVVAANTIGRSTAERLDLKVGNAADLLQGGGEGDEAFALFRGSTPQQNVGAISKATSAFFDDGEATGTFAELVARGVEGVRAFEGFAAAGFQAVEGLGAGLLLLEIEEESVGNVDLAAFAEEFLIFDPGIGPRLPFDQDPEFPSVDDMPLDLEDEVAFDEFLNSPDGPLMQYLVARWLSSEALITYAAEKHGMDITLDGGNTLEDFVAFRERLEQIPEEERTREDQLLIAYVKRIEAEHAAAVALFERERQRQLEALAGAEGFEPLDVEQEDVESEEGFDTDQFEEQLEEFELDQPEPSASSTPPPSGFEQLRVVGQEWSEGGIGVEDSWWTRLKSAWPSYVEVDVLGGRDS